MDPVSLFRSPEFPALVARKLSEEPCDFAGQMRQIDAESGTSAAPRRLAGVLLPLHFCPSGAKPDSPGEFCFQLIERSAATVQAGDIGCPGGMIRPSLDRLLSLFIRLGAPPVLPADVRPNAEDPGAENGKWVRLFLTTALRESWEEIGLAPWNVRCLGPLPTHALTLFRRIIFPLVGFLPRAYSPRISPEVERLLEIPLRFFLDPSRYAHLVIEIPDDIRPPDIPARREFSCFLFDGSPEAGILWGATFTLIAGFFRIVLGIDLPPSSSHSRTVVRRVGPEYLTGRR
ncbi:MAG: CoA pyrophosphatase [Syntrophales bacterium]|jgi:8-oxo-dGTP pyrophosphatase MutT (NUDIX family)|nr:CoA pyrophosphatase [Syntrophales bacterium]